VLDGAELVEHRREQPGQRTVDEQDAILGMVDDPGQLLGDEPQVQRVQDRSHARDGEVGLEMLLVVPAERRHPVALGDAECP
jgi:hypothetical protein